MLALIGSLLLANVLLKLWRLRSASDSLDRLVLGTIAFMIVAIWIPHLMHLRKLDKLTEQLDEATLFRLSTTAFVTFLFAYLMVSEALLLMCRH